MTGPKNALGAWGRSALRPVELPSGMKALVKLPDVSLLVQSGKMPRELTSIAMKFATTGVQVSSLKSDEIMQFVRLTYELIANAVKYLSTDPAAWDAFRESGADPSDEGWEPVTLTGGEVAEMEIDQSDLEALGRIVSRTSTTNEVTMLSRIDRGLLTPEGAAAALAGDADEQVGDFATFRREPGSPDDRPDGEGVRPAAERPARSPRSRSRARTR